MYKKAQSEWIKYFAFMIIDLICLEVAFLMAYLSQYGLDTPYHRASYGNMAILLILIDLVIVLFNESYKGILKRGYYKEFMASFKHTTLIVMGVGLFLLFAQIEQGYSGGTFSFMWGTNIVFSYVGRLIWKRYLKSGFALDPKRKRSLLVITSTDRANTVIQNISENNFADISITGVCVVDDERKGTYIEGIPVVANEEDVLEYICHSWVDEVFVNIARELPLSEKLINNCIEMGVTVHLELAKVSNMKGHKQVVENVGGYTVLSSSINMISNRQQLVKRIIDILGGVTGTLATGILFLFVAPMIYIKSPGPIFFTQWRVGRSGRRFKIYKFRSMYTDAEERKKELMNQNKMDGFMFKLDSDPRIIGGERGKGIGNFLRNTSIDEFPQFLNVLKGEMSLVGTRPPTIDEWDKYKLSHRKRLAIKPGITGMWQVSGRSDITAFEEVVKLDEEYIIDWSLGLDIKILFKTLSVVLGRRGSI